MLIFLCGYILRGWHLPKRVLRGLAPGCRKPVPNGDRSSSNDQDSGVEWQVVASLSPSRDTPRPSLDGPGLDRPLSEKVNDVK